MYFLGSNNNTIAITPSQSLTYGVHVDGYLYSYDDWFNYTHNVGSYDYSSSNNRVYRNNFVGHRHPDPHRKLGLAPNI